MASLGGTPAPRRTTPTPVLPETPRTRLQPLRGPPTPGAVEARRPAAVGVSSPSRLVATAGGTAPGRPGRARAGTRIGGIDVGGLTPASKARADPSRRSATTSRARSRCARRRATSRPPGRRSRRSPGSRRRSRSRDERGAPGDELRARVGLGGSRTSSSSTTWVASRWRSLLGGARRLARHAGARRTRCGRRRTRSPSRAAATGYGVDRRRVDRPARHPAGGHPGAAPQDAARRSRRARPRSRSATRASCSRSGGTSASARRWSRSTRRRSARWCASCRQGGDRRPARPRRSSTDGSDRSRSSRSAPRDARWNTDGKRAALVPAREGRALDVDRIELSLTQRPRLHGAPRQVRRRPAEAHDREGQVVPHHRGDLGVHDLPPVLRRPGDEHPSCRRHPRRDGDPARGHVLPQRGARASDDRGAWLRRRPPDLRGPARRMRSAAASARSRRRCTTPPSSAGMRIDQHQPHEFYISRYPMGREATVSWGGPEMIWTNDWPAGVLIRTAYTDTSITVRLYSSKLGRRVETETSEPCCYEQPQTFTSVNSVPRAGRDARRPVGRARQGSRSPTRARCASARS